MGKLNKQFKKKWLSALRSGEYKKGKGQLRTKDNRFCCLGVACEIKGLTPVHLGSGYGYGYAYDNLVGGICTDHRAELNISWKQHNTLIYLNDQNPTFKEVIRYISRNM